MIANLIVFLKAVLNALRNNYHVQYISVLIAFRGLHVCPANPTVKYLIFVLCERAWSQNRDFGVL